mmetsp:Transcript_5240/g.15237  ORF Transcript_5240/g.15237 Transcript_5240/m.15237 type:complete len:207 (+) Transcript_5240:529-1149(+)
MAKWINANFSPASSIFQRPPMRWQSRSCPIRPERRAENSVSAGASDPTMTPCPLFLKQFFSGIGIGPPWMTLPAVLPGYFGDPNGRREWIEESLKQGQLAGRWPNVLELDEDERILSNKFDDTPLGVGSWGRRPFELATLRLQNIIGIQIKHWSKLKPVDDRCLTQHGGCTVVGKGGSASYSWVDRGLCDVPDMHHILEILSAESQ